MEHDDSDDRDGTDPVEREHMAAGAERTGVSLSSCSLPRIPLRDPSVLPSRVGPNHDRTRRRLARTVGAGGDHADPDHRHQDEDPLRDSGPMTRPVDTHGDDEQPERREPRDDRRDPQVGPPRSDGTRAAQTSMLTHNSTNRRSPPRLCKLCWPDSMSAATRARHAADEVAQSTRAKALTGMSAAAASNRPIPSRARTPTVRRARSRGATRPLPNTSIPTMRIPG